LGEGGRRPGEGRFFTATFTEYDQLTKFDETLAAIGFEMPIAALRSEGWTLERSEVLALMAKLRTVGTPLGEYVDGKFYRGVLTGLNEAFVIDEASRERLIAEDPRSAELIKPWLRGRDIKKWQAEWAGLYVLFTRRGTDIEQYPAVKRHLEQFRADLEPKTSDSDKRGRKPGSYNWYEIQDNIAYYEQFEKTKISYQEIATYQSFGYIEPGAFCNNKCFLIPGKNDYLLALLNSKLLWWVICNLTSALNGGARAMQTPYIEQLPIPPATQEQQAPIIERVQQILVAQRPPLTPPEPGGGLKTPLLDKEGQGVVDIPALEAEIDRLVYALYGLTDEEIALVEGKVSKND
jgi:hypothetical protein